VDVPDSRPVYQLCIQFFIKLDVPETTESGPATSHAAAKIEFRIHQAERIVTGNIASTGDEGWRIIVDDQRIAVQTRRLRVAPGIDAEESQFKIIVGLKCTVLNQTDIDTGSPARIEVVCVNSAAGDCRVGEQQLPVRTCAMQEHRTGTNSPGAARIATVVGTTLTCGLNDGGHRSLPGRQISGLGVGTGANVAASTWDSTTSCSAAIRLDGM
jgi:hypothetical protein